MRVTSFLSKFKIFGDSFKNLYEDDCLTQSSSISFVFLLSIIPFAMLNIFIFNLIQRIAFPDFTITENIRDFFAKETVRFVPIISEEWVKSRLIYSRKALASFRIINFILLPILLLKVRVVIMAIISTFQLHYIVSAWNTQNLHS